MLEGLKPLNIDQYEQCRSRAIDRVKSRIGDRPTRDQFKRELEPLWTILDTMAVGVFVFALIVSSIHIIIHMGNQVSSYTGEHADLYRIVHQVAFVPLAEISMILFLVMFAMTPRENWRKWVYFVLSAAALVFILIANVQSNIGALESLLAPVFTIGIGLMLERKIVQTLERRGSVNAQYLAAVGVYELATADPTDHPDYLPILRNEIWAKLISLGTNKTYADAPVALKHAAVKREMERDTWAYGDNNQPMPDDWKPSVRGKATEPDRPFGITAQDWVEPESIRMTPSVNGHGTTETNNGHNLTK